MNAFPNLKIESLSTWDSAQFPYVVSTHQFQSLKETLRPCTSLSTSSSSSSTQGPQPSALPRKPPKSSLSQQLQRLGDPWVSFPQESPSQEAKHTNIRSGSFENYEEEEDADKELGDFERPKMGRFHFDHTGPFEPLPLSPPGELPIVQVPASINCRLLEHQKEGVKFLYKLYRNNHGGILGDDMGLGKTIQTIAFLAAAIGREGESGDSTLVRENQATKSGHALIICPTSVIHNWETEFSRWATFNVSVYHGATRDLILEKLEARGVEVLITSFDTFRIHGNILSEILWEIVIVDEAHRLKNEKSKLYKACTEICTRKRFGLTGTVMQNKIMELFNLFDWVAPGSLGTREHFREFYDEPLKHGQRATAPEKFVQVADERKEHLVRVLHKYMLRRTKEETIGHLMMGKEDNVIFCAMSELQKRVYRRMLQLSDVQCLINKDLPCSCGSPLKQVECCKRIVPDGIIWPYLHRDNPEGCDSCPFCLVLPCLVKLQQISNHLELIKPNPRDEPDKQRKDAEFASAVFGPDIDLVGGQTRSENFMELSEVKNCGKMRALEKLMFSWVSQGDKILLFSYSVRMLDILEKFLIRKGYSFARLDGSTPTNLRQSMVDDFNSSPSKQVFLISTRAGGLGLNLVSANRVVIFDPNWNPAHDLQAQDRSFRFGQKRHVVVFRLLAAGSFEELVYSRQVYKQQLSNIAVSGKMEKRYFEGVQDCKQFQGELFGICNLFRDLSDKLFTSEIIELHEKDRNDDAHCSATKQERAALDNEKGTTCKPVLEEMGVLYAHRNDEVINVVNLPKKKIARTSAEDYEIATIKQRKKPADDKGRKKKHYVRLSQSLGLGEVEFSKWVLSASPYEREQVLRDYKKRKEKAPSV
ncbi:hypothetical protein K2173_007794 [Erythroxylum novogranatense]|uniref:Switch 2 n=1 Tax=Erythroxylum novogranatense TaxID=1862640 RepID=A0AAV8TEP7_9ROSI|nr:hypothetical protein K2173_007794 [Erythroxylum novogranatense]